ncbi:MAG: hypothetical protein ACRDYC_13510, partial [Acidimicrobiales bacterium]
GFSRPGFGLQVEVLLAAVTGSWDSWSDVFPPYGVPPGEPVDDARVLESYALEGPPCFGRRLHIEGPTLIVDADVAAGLRVAPDVVLVRVDLPEETLDMRVPLEWALADHAGYELLDEENVLAVVVALQVLGIRLSSWNVWGKDLESAFDALRRGAVGEQELPRLPTDLPF